METERLLLEFENIVESIAKFKCLENEDEDLPYEQLKAMKEYKRILAIRILTIMERYTD